MIIVVILCASLFFACGSNTTRTTDDNITTFAVQQQTGMNDDDGEEEEEEKKRDEADNTIKDPNDTQDSVNASELENIIIYMHNKNKVNKELEKYFYHIKQFYHNKLNAENAEFDDYDSMNNKAIDEKYEYYDDIGYQVTDENSQLYSSNIIKALEKLVTEDTKSRNKFFKEFKAIKQASTDDVNEKEEKEYISKFREVLELIRKYINLYCQAKLSNAIDSIPKEQKDIYGYVTKSLDSTS